MGNFKKNNKENKKCNIKLTLNTLFLSISTLLLFFYKKEITYFNYNIITNFQFWRVITSFFYSQNEKFLLMNIFCLIFLSLLREPKKGSFAYFIDLVLKQFLIFSFSIFFYFILIWSGKVYGDVFKNLAENQKDLMIGGLAYILTSELLVTLFFMKKNKNLKEEKFFFKNSFLLALISVVIFYFYFDKISYWAAIFVGILEITGIFKFYQCIQNSNLNFIVENNVFLCNSFFYYFHEEFQNSFYENNKLMKTESTMSVRNYSSINSDINKIDGFEDGRYEKVIIDDYISKTDEKKMKNLKPNESFEI